MLVALLLATACDLLQPKEIAAVQGAAPSATTPSSAQDGALAVQRCFFTLPQFDRSVSLEVRRGTAAEVKKAWKRMEEHEGEEDDKGAAAREVRGVGQEALWAGDGRAGALFVRSSKAILRLSVGGPASADEKLKACTALARTALKRVK